MLKKIIQFIKYNNAFSIGFALVFLSFGGALAAGPEGRQAVADAVYNEKETIRSIDNSYIVNVDLNSYVPKVQITSVTEDEEFYYVAYTLYSIDIVNSVWQQAEKINTLKVAKNDLGKRDLGSYVTGELKEIIDRQVSLLKETQNFEKRNGATDKVVVTEYSGLVGKFLDAKEDKIQGYVPVKSSVSEPETAVSSSPSSTIETTSPQPNTGQTGSVKTSSSSISVVGGDDTIPPTLTILGNNPARLNVNDSYVDLGVYVTDNKSINIGYSVALDGKAVGQISIDTIKPGEHEITYTATDQAGNITTATRMVIITDPYSKATE